VVYIPGMTLDKGPRYFRQTEERKHDDPSQAVRQSDKQAFRQAGTQGGGHITLNSQTMFKTKINDSVGVVTSTWKAWFRLCLQPSRQVVCPISRHTQQSFDICGPRLSDVGPFDLTGILSRGGWGGPVYPRDTGSIPGWVFSFFFFFFLLLSPSSKM
jgi:hypothetical protein